MSLTFPIPETRILAVASHVVSGYVGNKVAVFILQILGCDVSAINTVHFSNHTGYGHVKGTRTTATHISDLYDGLKLTKLDEFDMMLTGYIPGALAVEAVGRIAKELKQNAAGKPGSFFWVLDPVMGDNGKLYVAEDSIAAYKDLIPHVDLILPNQFEAELLSGIQINDMITMSRAIQTLHERYKTPHIIITSAKLAISNTPQTHLSVIGSSRTSFNQARIFEIAFPLIDCFFSGTGDMFAALVLVRLREAVASENNSLLMTDAWLSDDSVKATDLPLARAVEKVLGSMHRVLMATQMAMGKDEPASMESQRNGGKDDDALRRSRSEKSKAAEIRLIRHAHYLRDPEVLFRAVEI